MESILVIDDDPMVRSILAMMLYDAGFEVIEAADPAAAREVMLAKKPDLVTIDIDLSGPPGLELITEIRKRALLKDVPIVAFRSYAGKPAVVVGADVTFDKPLNIQDILDTVQSLLPHGDSVPESEPEPEPVLKHSGKG
ncbi:MAG TPA: response regulator [Firmicutes bacterium]|nr:response regulator [Bacillota bacterium]